MVGYYTIIIPWSLSASTLKDFLRFIKLNVCTSQEFIRGIVNFRGKSLRIFDLIRIKL